MKGKGKMKTYFLEAMPSLNPSMPTSQSDTPEINHLLAGSASSEREEQDFNSPSNNENKSEKDSNSDSPTSGQDSPPNDSLQNGNRSSFTRSEVEDLKRGGSSGTGDFTIENGGSVEGIPDDAQNEAEGNSQPKQRSSLCVIV